MFLVLLRSKDELHSLGWGVCNNNTLQGDFTQGAQWELGDSCNGYHSGVCTVDLKEIYD